MTDATRQVLQALLTDPARERYGIELSKDAGIAQDMMYGILVRLEDWGWVKNRLEYSADRATPPHAPRFGRRVRPGPDPTDYSSTVTPGPARSSMRWTRSRGMPVPSGRGQRA